VKAALEIVNRLGATVEPEPTPTPTPTPTTAPAAQGG
jgi:hypothetical protein